MYYFDEPSDRMLYSAQAKRCRAKKLTTTFSDYFAQNAYFFFFLAIVDVIDDRIYTFFLSKSSFIELKK